MPKIVMVAAYAVNTYHKGNSSVCDRSHDFSKIMGFTVVYRYKAKYGPKYPFLSAKTTLTKRSPFQRDRGATLAYTLS